MELHRSKPWEGNSEQSPAVIAGWQGRFVAVAVILAACRRGSQVNLTIQPAKTGCRAIPKSCYKYMMCAIILRRAGYRLDCEQGPGHALKPAAECRYRHANAIDSQ